MPKVHFLRSGVEVDVETGSNLRQVALKNNVQLYPGPHKLLNCHGLSQCGTCRVLLKEGTEKNASPMTMLEKMRTLEKHGISLAGNRAFFCGRFRPV